MPFSSNAFFDHRIGLAPDNEILSRQSHHFRPDLHGKITKRIDTLYLQRHDDERCEFRILGEIEPNLLDQLFGEGGVAIIGYADRYLINNPVAAHVLDRAQQTERHGEDRPAVMPQF